MSTPHATLTSAQLEWKNGQPVSSQFDDIYFSSLDGWAETQAVFIRQNNLENRWKDLSPGSAFTIGETGFGSGLNFLCALALWLKTAPSDCVLHYISTEKHPLKKIDLEGIISHWNDTAVIPESLKPLCTELIAGYPLPLAIHYRCLAFTAWNWPREEFS